VIYSRIFTRGIGGDQCDMTGRKALGTDWIWLSSNMAAVLHGIPHHNRFSLKLSAQSRSIHCLYFGVGKGAAGLLESYAAKILSIPLAKYCLKWHSYIHTRTLSWATTHIEVKHSYHCP